MKRTSLLVAAMLSSSLIAMPAMAQTTGAANNAGTNAGQNVNAGANTGMNNTGTNNAGTNNAGMSNAGATNAGTNGTGVNPNVTGQRLTQENASGTGAILTIAPSGVRQVQQALNRLGYAAGVVNGVWSQSTAQAMVNFQQAHGLEPTGNLNIGSIAALGLWDNLIGDPLGNGRSAMAAAPPARGGQQQQGTPHVGNLPSQRIVNERTSSPNGGSAANTGANQSNPGANQ